MKIYTKSGDQGSTALLGRQRVEKDHLKIHAYGTVDELNAVLGMALAQADFPEDWEEPLTRIQGELFQLGAELATPVGQKTFCKLLEQEAIERLEREIDAMEEKLAPLKNFILPGGTGAASVLHMGRTVCRRVERHLISLNRNEELRAEVIQFFNRLSDYLFVMARLVNSLNQVEDRPWRGA